MYREVFHMTRKKKEEDKELDKLDKVQFDEEGTSTEPTVELLKELLKINKEIKDILSRLKDRFI